ncbi:MAG: TetR/AcrR family transcriptional regulator [Actinomycetota bacterium]
MSTDQQPVRAKRKDAAVNGERLVQAARDVFARRGLSATLEDIARQAGVGVGTVYRNFASKREIVETLYSAALDSVLTDMRSALKIDDPWLAIATFFETTATHQARDRGLCELFLGREGFGLNERIADELIDGLSALFTRAHAAGVLRAGVGFTDAWPIFAMLYGIYGVSDEQPELWRRYLQLMLDGLRAVDGPPLPAPALDEAWFRAAMIPKSAAAKAE